MRSLSRTLVRRAVRRAVAGAVGALAVGALAVGALPPSAVAQDVTIRDSVIQHLRPYTQRGLNAFEPPKYDSVAYTGPRLKIGAAFTQQFQGLRTRLTGSL